MAREYGNDRTANINIRATEQEKEQLKAAADKLNISVSQLLRKLITDYAKEIKE